MQYVFVFIPPSVSTIEPTEYEAVIVEETAQRLTHVCTVLTKDASIEALLKKKIKYL